VSVPTDLFFFKAFKHFSNSASVNGTSNSSKMFSKFILLLSFVLILPLFFNSILMSGIFPESSYPFSRMVMLTIQGITEGFHYFPMSENFLPR
jgi:hypothetical protein